MPETRNIVISPDNKKRIEIRPPLVVDLDPSRREPVARKVQLIMGDGKVGVTTPQNARVRYRVYLPVKVQSRSWISEYTKDGLDHGYFHIVEWIGWTEGTLNNGKAMAVEGLLVVPAKDVKNIIAAARGVKGKSGSA